MSKNYLEIDLSGSNKESDGEDLMKIQLRSGNTVQFNFSRFFFRSKFVFNKYSEIMESIEKEINKIENEFEIKEEIIKEFIEIIQEEKVIFPIEHFKEICTLAKHFCVPKLTNLLDNMMENLINTDLNFCIQILLDYKSTEKEEEIKTASKIEKFLKSHVNDCLKNEKFKELPITTIFRIINSADKEIIDFNILLDFILESAMNRLILFKFLELHKLRNDKIEEFIKFVDNQKEDMKQIYLEYIPFNLIYIKKMKHNNDELSNDFNRIREKLKQTQEESKQAQKKLKQTQEESKQAQKKLKQTQEESKQAQEELKQTQEKLKQTQEELKQTQEELKQTQEELKQAQEESKQIQVKLKQTQEESKQFQDKLNQAGSYMKKFADFIMVGGRDDYNQLGEKSNKKYGATLDKPVIHPSLKSSINPASILSFSIYCWHSIQVTRSGKLLGIGDNSNGRICDSLPKTEIKEFTEFSIRDRSGSQLDPVSAVCCGYGTLYMFSSGSRRQLVLCDSDINGGHPVFLDIGDEYPVSLFGGFSHSAAINNKGEVIFINRDAVKKSPESNIKPVSLPDEEKAVSVGCCENSVIALSSNGRVFASSVVSGSNVLKFSTVSELSGQEIVCISGIRDHFLVVSREGRVFGRGSNEDGKLGLGQTTAESSSFTEIPSLNNYKIRAAYAGSYHSLFETSDGKILSCGYNDFSELLLRSDSRETVYSPTETTITESATFCIAGGCLSVVFIGGDPPPNTPNRLIQKYE